MAWSYKSKRTGALAPPQIKITYIYLGASAPKYLESEPVSEPEARDPSSDACGIMEERG